MQHPEPHDITALAYGMIEGHERESLLTHLSKCDACRAVYDGYREEQASVRDSIVRDARSGAAEARALESTLRMLGALESDKPRGRLLRLPRWVLVAEVAAMLAVAVGLFFILKPSGEPELVPIAEELRAPATVDGGVVYVSDRQGDWKPAEAVPMDEWVMAGEIGALILLLDNGSRAKIDAGSVFRVGRDGNSRQVALQFLRGNGDIDTSEMAGNMFVRGGEAGFYAMPDARFSINSGPAKSAAIPRLWDQAERVNASVRSGNIVLWPEGSGYGKLPLQGGDRVEWTPEDFKVYTQSGEMVPLRRHVAMDSMPELLPRFRQLQTRLDGFSGDPRGDELLAYVKLLGTTPPRQVAIMEGTRVNDSVTITLTEADATRTIKLYSDGATIHVEVADGSLRLSFRGDSPEQLKASTSVPQDVREMLEGVNFERDDKGNYRIRGADISATREGQKVKVKTISSE